MEIGNVDALDAWVTGEGLRGLQEVELLTGFCDRAREGGLPIASAMVIIDTLHPVHEGRAFRWSLSSEESVVTEYGRTNQGGEAAERWRRSPMYALMQSGDETLRRRVTADGPTEFPVIAEMREAGQTDFLATMHRFAPHSVIGEMDCVYSSWASDAVDGFSDGDIAALHRLGPALALAVKAASLARIAETLVETYLGRDAGRRVLSGRIERGVADRIEAALWFSDLRSYTRITGAAPPEQIIPLLNDYAEAIISAIEGAGGDVLKLIGDGILAIFNAENRSDACTGALRAADVARESVRVLNEKRAAKNLPITGAYLGLHVGEVYYGNIGSKTRLDFTVVGPAVNEVSRIAAMCRSADRDVLTSGAFAQSTAAGDRDRLVSVGRYALRGVEQPQELFTFVASDTPEA